MPQLNEISWVFTSIKMLMFFHFSLFLILIVMSGTKLFSNFKFSFKNLNFNFIVF